MDLLLIRHEVIVMDPLAWLTLFCIITASIVAAVILVLALDWAVAAWMRKRWWQ